VRSTPSVQVSALVTGEYYASPKHFPGFGRPYLFNSELLMRVGRRDGGQRLSAHCAALPLVWTLGVPNQVSTPVTVLYLNDIAL